MSEKVIEIKNVRKTYQLYDKPINRLKEALSPGKKCFHTDHFALDCITADVNKGECMGIIGTNGSGKSTLLKIVTGVLNPTEGEVKVHGKISALLELGTGFNPEYTGIENIYLSGTMQGFTEEEMEAKIDSIIEFAEIGDFIHQPVKTYSSGMFARLAFAVAINVDPDILIVDEALSVGDIFFQAKCYRKFNEFKDAGKTILFVSHDLGSIIKYCDRCLLIHNGKQIALDKSTDVVNIYKKILVNQYDEEEIESDTETNDIKSDNYIDIDKKSFVTGSGELWKKSLIENPNFQDYGDGRATIVDFAIIDDEGNISSSIYKWTNFQIKMKIHFNVDVDNPIFAYTIKDLKGTEISGTNTMLEDSNLSCAKEGQDIVVTFSQKMNLQGGQYLLSLGCTGYKLDEFQVFHRLYDICNLQVISDRNTIGFVDMDAKISYVE